jgi:hypothetical protein
MICFGVGAYDGMSVRDVLVLRDDALRREGSKAPPVFSGL